MEAERAGKGLQLLSADRRNWQRACSTEVVRTKHVSSAILLLFLVALTAVSSGAPPDQSQPATVDRQQPELPPVLRPLKKDAASREHSDKKLTDKKKDELPTKEARLDFIRRAQVWAPTNVSAMDLRAGPQDKGAFQPNAMVSCDYVQAKLPGTSRKFDCDVDEGDVVKVRYGSDNGKVEGSVLASRLLWALGFGADRLYPVRVTCRGCSSDPWKDHKPVPGETQFDPAVIERKPPGHEMKSAHKGGWAWPELDQVDESLGGAPKAQRDALKLFAVLVQHTDNKPEQERLLCLPKGLTAEGACDRPFMMLHDVGLTFGEANLLNSSSVGSVSFEHWKKTPIWQDAKACVGKLNKSATGTLSDPVISEEGRRFLADLLVQLTDSQLHDLFDVARVDLRSRRPDSNEPPASVDEWVTVFKQKRAEIVNNHCPK